MADIEQKLHPYLDSNDMPPTLAEEKSSVTEVTIEDEKQLGIFRKVTQFLLRWGIETHGQVLRTSYWAPFDS